MSAIDDLFCSLRQQQRKAFMPFVTAGDPDLSFTQSLIERLDGANCSLCEIGFPYSDPIADGPVIQASYTRALAQGVRTHEILDMLRAVSGSITMPRVAMVSYAIVYRIGPRQFVDNLKSAGISGVIVPDMLVEESSELAKICRDQDVSLIQLVTPTTPRERAVRIAEATTGFIYYVSVTGITGERRELPPELREDVSWLRTQTDLPICIGFGISQPEHVRSLSEVADGLIVGSAIVRRVAEASERPREQVLDSIETYVKSLMAELP